MSQIGLPFDWSTQAQPDLFLVSEANRLALRHIEQWRDWPVPISILSGPARSGKSTLGRHFARLSDGHVIDDAEREEEQSLFHQWNIARDSGRPLLLIAQVPPAQWRIGLADLRSRIAAASHMRLEEPDDALVLQLIEMGLARAGSAYAPDVPEWLARRIERSYAAVAGLLVQLNKLSLARSRKISVPMLKEALQNSGVFSIVEGEPEAETAPATDQEEER